MAERLKSLERSSEQFGTDLYNSNTTVFGIPKIDSHGIGRFVCTYVCVCKFELEPKSITCNYTLTSGLEHEDQI